MYVAFRVALLIETSNRYGRDLLHGVRDWIHHGEKWALRFTEQARGAPLPSWMKEWKGDGVIARVDSQKISSALVSTGLPVVDVSADRLASKFPRVSIDNRAVACLAADHLKNKALRHFAFIGDARFDWSQKRGAEFVSLLRGTGGVCSAFPSSTSGGGPGSDADLDRISRWLKRLPKPVGVFACYDNRAQQVLEACQLARLKVPEEVAVVGVDNDELLCELCTPPLTSVLPNARLTGYEAASMLSRMMRGERLASQTRYVEPIRVVERQSSETIAVEDPKISAALRFIAEHACEGINVADVLRAVPISRTLFDKRFKSLLGHSPHEHIVRKRLERAKQWLVESDLSVTVISELAGFESVSYFSTVFRRGVGVSPYKYRGSRRASSGYNLK